MFVTVIFLVVAYSFSDFPGLMLYVLYFLQYVAPEFSASFLFVCFCFKLLLLFLNLIS